MSTLGSKLAKSLSWRVHASATTLIVSYLYTGTLELAGGIAATLMVIKFGLYVYHEAVWERLPGMWDRFGPEGLP